MVHIQYVDDAANDIEVLLLNIRVFLAQGAYIDYMQYDGLIQASLTTWYCMSYYLRFSKLSPWARRICAIRLKDLSPFARLRGLRWISRTWQIETRCRAPGIFKPSKPI